MITFFVPGVPQTKGSTRGFAVLDKRTGKHRAIITNDNAKARPWQDAISWAAHAAGCTKAEPGQPVAVMGEFILERPTSHYGKKGLRPSAPEMLAGGNDADKMMRVVCDALTGIAYHDDRQVTCGPPIKRYAEPNEMPGVIVSIRLATPGLHDRVRAAFLENETSSPKGEVEREAL